MARPVMTWARSLRCLASSTGVAIAASTAADALEPAAGLDERVLDVVGVGHGQPLAGVRSEGLAQQRRPMLDDTGDQRRVVEDPPQRAGQRDEPAGRQLHADGVAHHVLEDVGLVEHDDVVLGQDHAAAADVRGRTGGC